jgi:alpha-L-fucosidase
MSGGSGGSAPSAGTGGVGVVDHLLSQAKPATADSEQSSQGHTADSGNDGSLTTRWCANDSATGHYWKVDLGAVSTLSKLEVTWEKALIYKFKVEGSADGNTWSPLLDQTTSSNAAADQTYPLSGSPTARWVRLTVTGLANTSTWASFFEFSVYGH